MRQKQETACMESLKENEENNATHSAHKFIRHREIRSAVNFLKRLWTVFKLSTCNKFSS